MQQTNMSENTVKPVEGPVSAPIETEAPSAVTAENTSGKEADDVLNRPAEEPARNLIPEDHYLSSPLFHEIANYFSIESKDYEAVKDKLSVITDYVINKEDSNKLEDVMMGIRKLEDNIQPPNWGEKRYDNIYRWLRLATQRDAVDKAMNSLERKVRYA